MIEAAISNETHERFMSVALERARRGLAAGEPPVGACLVRDGEVIAALNNAVIGELDVTAHAEIRVIRAACHRLRSLDLTGCQLFVTVEPCPMCLSACHYASIAHVVYGARLADMHAVTGRELMSLRTDVIASPSVNLRLTGDCLRDECRALLDQWARTGCSR